MAGISSVDCVGPAFSLMRKRLFQPFRFEYWSRMAVLGILAGEVYTGGNGGGGGHSGAAYHPADIPAGVPGKFDPTWMTQHWNHILCVIGVLVVIGLVFFYIGSVMRFVLYEAVLRDKASIREGFARWREQGLDYFSFRLMMVLPYAALAIYLVGVPVLRVIKTGGGGPEIVSAIAALISSVLLVLTLGILLAIGLILTKDFVVPQMMLEGITCGEGWKRLWNQIKADPMNFIGYLLVKIVLAIAASVVFVIMLIVAVIIAAIPIAILAGLVFVAFKAAGGGALAIAGAVVLAIVLVLPLILYCVGFVGAPIAVFFPAYSIQFFASRYKPLYDELYPQPAGGQF